jgi:hypothetical protein
MNETKGKGCCMSMQKVEKKKYHSREIMEIVKEMPE